MTQKAKKVSDFKSEDTERRFWATHDSSDYVDWGRAQPIRLPNLKPSTETISLRLPRHLLDSIRPAANSRDVPYQSLIKLCCRRSWRASSADDEDAGWD